MKKMLALASVLIALVGCSAPERGTVYEKKYSAAWSYWDSQCMVYGKSGLCTMRMPVQHTIPESWQLCLRDRDEQGCRDVDQITWHQYEVGQEYP